MESGSFAASEPVSQAATGAKAGFWARFVALLIDAIVIGVANTIVALALHGIGLALYLVTSLISLTYFAYLEGSTGQTLGKKSMQIRVVDADSGGPIGYGRAVGRWFGRFVSELVIFLGYFWMIWDSNKQCWHDKMVNDYVVKSD